MPKPARESVIEKYLVSQVKLKGGEIRKVKWIARDKAPDRFIMLPVYESSGVSFYAEIKEEGGHLVFPKNAHEEAQHREHERMRRCGLRVEVIGSKQQVDEILNEIYS